MKGSLPLLAGAGAAAVVGLTAPPPVRALTYELTGTGTVTSCQPSPEPIGSCPASIAPPAPFTFELTFTYAPFSLISGEVSLFGLANPPQPTTLDPWLTGYSPGNESLLVLAGTTTGGTIQVLTLDLPPASLPSTVGPAQSYTGTASFTTCNSPECIERENQQLVGTANVSFTVAALAQAETPVPGHASLLAIAPLAGVIGRLRRRYRRP